MDEYYAQFNERLMIVERRSTKNEARLEFVKDLKHEERITRFERVLLGAVPITIAVAGWLLGNAPKFASLLAAIK